MKRHKTLTYGVGPPLPVTDWAWLDFTEHLRPREISLDVRVEEV